MNFEWMKILVSVLAGMIAGLIADPIRGNLARKLEILRIKRAIGLDLDNLITSRAFYEEGCRTPEQFWQSKMFPSFNFYWERNREYFYSNSEMHRLRMHIQAIHTFQDARNNGSTSVAECATAISAAMERIGIILWKRRQTKLGRLISRIFGRFL